MRSLLLDTHAVIWLAHGDPIRAGVQDEVIASGLEGRLYVSPVSAWEVGLLARKPVGRGGLAFLPDAKTWFARIMAWSIVTEAPLTSERAIDASLLPGELHRDPADRLLVATARDLGATLVTRDARLLAYATAGHLQALAC